MSGGADVVGGGSERPPRRLPRALLLVGLAAAAALLLLRGPDAAVPRPVPSLQAGPSASPAPAAARLYVPACDRDGVARLEDDGTPVRLAGTPGRATGPDGRPVAAGRSDCPEGLAFDDAGLLHVVGPDAARLRVVGPGGTVRDLAGRLRDPRRALGLRALLVSPGAVAVDARGLVYVGSPTAARVLRVDARGRLRPLGPPDVRRRPVSDPARPAVLAVLDDLSVCFADGGSSSVYRVDRDGRTTRLVGTGVSGSSGGGGPAARAQLDGPRAVAVDVRGRLYVTEGAGRRVRRLEPDGTLRTVAGSGARGDAALALVSPGDVAVLGPDLYVVDLGGRAVHRLGADGRVETLGS